MRVAVVSPYDLRREGGVQDQVRQLTVRLRAGGHQAWAVGPGTPADLGVDVGGSISVPANGSRAPICLQPGAIVRVRRAVAGSDVVHLHEPLMPLIGPALLTAGYPLDLTMHAAAPSWARRLYRLTPRTWWQGRVLTAVSSAAVPPLDHPVRIIPNGIGLDLYRPEGEKQPRRVVFLGRDDPRKGLSILRSAWPLVRTRVPGAELFVLGAEGESQEGLSFRGRVSEEEKQAQLGAAAVLVAPNTGGESFGISLVEGMAAGCALVASDLAAFREVSGGAARLVPPGDPLALAGALADLLVDPTARAELGERARVQAARYDWSAVLPQYLQCYLALTGGSPSPG